MKYTAEEVRARFEAWAEENGYDVLRNDGFTAAAWHGYQTAYAERIEADEVAVPVAHFIETSPGNWEQAAAEYVGQPGVVPLFTHPPAQAAQGEASRGRCIACGRATDSACDGLNGAGLGCMIAMPRGEPS